MITIQLTDKQYDLVRLALSISKKHLDDQLRFFKGVGDWKFKMIKEMESVRYDIYLLKQTLEYGLKEVIEERKG